MTDATTESLDRKVHVATILAALSGVGAAIMLVAAKTSPDQGISTISMLVACAFLACLAVYAMVSAAIRDKRRKAYRHCATVLSTLQLEKDPSTIRDGWHNLCLKVRDPLEKQLIKLRKPFIEQQLEIAENAVARTRRQEKLGERLKSMRDHATARITHARASHPKLAARDTAVRNLAHVKARRIQLEADVDEILEGASWWQKLNYDDPDYRKMDSEIEKLERSVERFLSANGEDIRAATAKLDAAEARATCDNRHSRAQCLCLSDDSTSCRHACHTRDHHRIGGDLRACGTHELELRCGSHDARRRNDVFSGPCATRL